MPRVCQSVVRKMRELISRAELKILYLLENMRAAHSHINVSLLLILTLVPGRCPETSEVHLKQVLLQIPPLACFNIHTPRWIVFMFI